MNEHKQNMENLEKQLKKAFKESQRKQVRADSKWLSQTRLDLQKHMRENPAKISVLTQSKSRSWFAKPMMAITTALILLLAGGGTAMASWSAMPGDMLYPIKLASEKVIVALSVDEEAKAELHMKYADKRLEELEQISVDPNTAGIADSATLDLVIKNMESHINKVGEYLEAPSEPLHIAETALRIEEFTQVQAESIKRIETRSGEIMLPVLPRVRRINDEQIQKVTQALNVAREMLEENTVKDTVSSEEEVIKQVVIKRLNVLEGEKLETADVVEEAVVVEEQVPKAEISPSAHVTETVPVPVKESNKSGAVSDVYKQESVEDSYQESQNKIDDETYSDHSVGDETESVNDPSVGVVVPNNTQEIPKDADEGLEESVTTDGTIHNESDDGADPAEEIVFEEGTTTPESTDIRPEDQLDESGTTTTNNSVSKIDTTSQNAATLPAG